MTEFRALGTVEVEGVAPSEAETVRSHPRWIATLTCLLLPASGAARRRDELVSLLWPSVERTRGRSSLRVVLHGLRRHLGHDAIRSHGDELRIDRRQLTCDVLVFEELLSQRRHDEALAVYAGELLPGFAVHDAPEFVRWLVDRRESLRTSAAGAAWALAGAVERRGQWIDAVRYARRAVALSAESEAAVRRFLRLLDRAGDGASALHEYEKFADRWRVELGVEPSPETRAVVEEIRGRRGSPGPGRPVSASGSEDPRARPVLAPEPTRPDRWPHAGRMVALPFRIDGEDPRLEHLAAGLAHDVIASLARVSGIVVVARPSAAYTRGAVDRGPAEIGQQLDADLVFDTSVRVVSDRFILVGRLIDVRLERPIWAEAYDGTRAELRWMRRQLLHDVLRAAGVELSAAERERLARGQTSSPAAFELYVEARSRWSRRTREEVEASIALFQEALAIDPEFALAQAGLMDAYSAMHPAAGRRMSEARLLAREAARKALELDPELGEAHATLALHRIFMDQDFEGAEADLRRAIVLSPGHASAHHWLGALLAFARRRFDEGVAELETARQLDPCSPVIQADIGLALLNRGEVDEARRRLTAILEREPTFGRAHHYLGVALFVAGEPDRGFEHLWRAWRFGAFGADPDAQAGEALSRGDWREGLERKLGELTASGLQPGTRSFEAALISMLLGRRDESLEWLRVVGQESSWAWVTMYLPAFEPLMDDPAFVELMAEAGLGEALRGGNRSSA